MHCAAVSLSANLYDILPRAFERVRAYVNASDVQLSYTHQRSFPVLLVVHGRIVNSSRVKRGRPCGRKCSDLSTSGRRGARRVDTRQRWTFRRIITTLESCETDGQTGPPGAGRLTPDGGTSADNILRCLHFATYTPTRSWHRSIRVSCPIGHADNSASTDLESNGHLAFGGIWLQLDRTTPTKLPPCWRRQQ